MPAFILHMKHMVARDMTGFAVVPAVRSADYPLVKYLAEILLCWKYLPASLYNVAEIRLFHLEPF